MAATPVSTWLSRLWPLAVTAAIFVAIFTRIPFDRFVDALSGARLAPFLALMALFSLSFFAMDTFVLLRLLRWFHGDLRYRDLLPVRASTYVVSIVNTQLAQGALALYVHRRFLTPVAEIASTIMLLMLIEVTQLVVFATIGMLAFPSEVPSALAFVPVSIAAIWAFVFWVGRGGGGNSLARIREHVLFRTFRRARPSHVLAILALKAPIFLLALLMHWNALGFFGMDVPLGRLLAFLPIVFMVSALPVTVAHLGTSQAAWVFFFRDFAPEADLLAYSLASHLTFMLANGALGLAFLPRAYWDLFVDRKREDIGHPIDRGQTSPEARVSREGNG